MANKQSHRGAHPNDVKLFHDRWLRRLRLAARDFNYLLSRGYPDRSSLQLVGNRYRLNKRQQKAMLRVCMSDEQLQQIKANEVKTSQLEGQVILIDGFNVLITIESALSHAFLFEGRAGCYRDIASVHSTYRRVQETEKAFRIIGKHLKALKPASVQWYLDSPISNSGRLAQFGRTIAEECQFDWSFDLVANPDKTIAERSGIAISSDTWVLAHSDRWFNLTRQIVDQLPAPPPVIRLYAERA
ncbi:MAG: DUF434 domain-containing protein [Bacteroidota bacterium]